MEAIIRLCKVSDIENDAALPALLAGYARESSIPELGHGKAQFETYSALEQAGMLRVLGAYQGDALIGFIAILVSELPHYGCLVATTESFFVSPSARKGGVGRALLANAEALAASVGAKGMLVSAPTGGRLELVMQRSSAYRQTNSVFFKALA